MKSILNAGYKPVSLEAISNFGYMPLSWYDKPNVKGVNDSTAGWLASPPTKEQMPFIKEYRVFLKRIIKDAVRLKLVKLNDSLILDNPLTG